MALGGIHAANRYRLPGHQGVFTLSTDTDSYGIWMYSYCQQIQIAGVFTLSTYTNSYGIWMYSYHLQITGVFTLSTDTHSYGIWVYSYC